MRSPLPFVISAVLVSGAIAETSNPSQISRRSPDPILETVSPKEARQLKKKCKRKTAWQPEVGATWQIVLQTGISLSPSATAITPNVSVFDIDMYTNSNTTIAALHSLNKTVICYFSAGSYEPYRPDSSSFQPSDLGSVMDGWPDEKWIDINSANVRKIMAARIKLASDKGCDAIDPDNVDGYNNENGLGLTSDDSVSFVKFLSDEAAKYGMSTGLKNAGDIIPDVLPHVAFSVNEECAQYDECDVFADFISAGKPVFHIEYPDGVKKNKVSASAVKKACAESQFSTVLKDLDLDGAVKYCNGTFATTETASS